MSVHNRATHLRHLVDVGIDGVGPPTKGWILVPDGTQWKAVPVGTDDQVLTADSTADVGVAWKSGGSSDADAIHDNVAGEIAAVSEKLTPVSADLLLIEDSEAMNAKRRLRIGSLPTGGGTAPTETAKATRQSSVQSIADSTPVVVVFDTETWDTDAMVDVGGANPSRVTVQTAGKYALKAGVRFAANSTGDRILQILKNGTTVIAEGGANAMGNASVPTTLTVAVDDDAAATDYYQARVFQFSGAALDVAADQRNFLSAHRMS